MPAQSVASPTPAPAAASRNGPADGREPGTTDGQFGRQLDAVRNQHEKPAASTAAKQPDGAKKQADGQTAATADAPGAGAAESVEDTRGLAANVTGTGRDASGAGGDGHDDDAADADGVPQLALASLLPFLGAALPGATPHRGAFASSAGALLGAHGAAAITAGIADATRMLQAGSAVQTADGQPAAATVMTAGLESILEAVHGVTADDAHNPSAGVSAANLVSTQLPPLPAPAVGTHMLAVAAPLGSAGFHQDLAGQVAWLTSQDVKQARIRVHPEDLGPLDLKVSVSNDHVNVVFTAQHPGAVQALQQSLPQLGQMLAQHGLSLGHAEVGQHGGNGSSTPHRGGVTGAVDEPVEMQVSGISTVTGVPNLLDAFA